MSVVISSTGFVSLSVIIPSMGFAASGHEGFGR